MTRRAYTLLAILSGCVFVVGLAVFLRPSPEARPLSLSGQPSQAVRSSESPPAHRVSRGERGRVRPGPELEKQAKEILEPAGFDEWSKRHDEVREDIVREALEARSVVFNPNAPPLRRVDSLKDLVRAKAATPEVIAAVVPLLQNSQDAGIRIRLCEVLAGKRSDSLKTVLVARLQTDPHPQVRKRAAQALVPLRSEQDVEVALEQAAVGDPETTVRETIQRALSVPTAGKP